MRTLWLFIIIVTTSSAYNFLDIVKNYIHSPGKDEKFTLSNSKYDFIIIGAGSAGSVLANRLSENKKWRILLLEAGYMPNFFNRIPILVGYFQLTGYNWGYNVEPQKNACLGMKNRQCSWPRGRGLGGTSILNYMIHTRGNKFDYDQWASLGNVGWSYADVLPYFKKSERFNVPGTYTILLFPSSFNLQLIFPDYTIFTMNYQNFLHMYT